MGNNNYGINKVYDFLTRKKIDLYERYGALCKCDYIILFDNDKQDNAGVHDMQVGKVSSRVIASYLDIINNGNIYNWVLPEDALNMLADGEGYLDCFIKDTFDCEDCQSGRIVPYQTAEVMGSQLCGVMGLKTALNYKYKDSYKKVVSVSFLGKDEKMLPFCTLTQDRADSRQLLSSWLNVLIDFCKEKYDESIRSDMLNSLARDIIKTYFVKYLVLGDGDFHMGNVGIVHKDEDLLDASISPAFDFEYLFEEIGCNSGGGLDNFSIITKDLAYVIGKFPSQVGEVVDSLNREGLFADIKSVIVNNMGYTHKASIVYNYILDRRNDINKIYINACKNNKFAMSKE